MREPAVALGAAVSRVKPRRRKEVRDPYDGLLPWSAITHGIGAGLAVIGTLLLVGRSLWEGNWFHAVVFLVYGLSMICLYTASTSHTIPAVGSSRTRGTMAARDSQPITR